MGINLKSAARRARVSYHTVYRAVRSGELPATRHGGVYEVEEPELHRWMLERSTVRTTGARDPLGGARAAVAAVGLDATHALWEIARAGAAALGAGVVLDVVLPDGRRVAAFHHPLPGEAARLSELVHGESMPGAVVQQDVVVGSDRVGVVRLVNWSTAPSGPTQPDRLLDQLADLAGDAVHRSRPVLSPPSTPTGR